MGEHTSSPTWQELSGSDNWNGLLDPLHDDLRMYIIHYGEAGQSIGDAFNNEAASKALGFSRYPMDVFFPSVGLPWFKYDVTQFFYASELKQDNWIGYVAVSTDEGGNEELRRRDILVVWRGTMRLVEASLDIDNTLVSASDIFGEDHEDVMVHQGWHKIYTSKDADSAYTSNSARDQVVKEVSKQVEKYKDEVMSITVVGHSMGAAVATLNAMDIVANGHNYPTGQPDKACQVTVFAFASPKVGDQKFKELYDNLNEERNLHALRIFNEIDIVPSHPLLIQYHHVGKKLMVDSRKSTYLRPVAEAGLAASLQIAHQLEVILHVVAGWNGSKGKFDIKSNRHYSLANKDMEALANTESHKYNVPASWWVVQNKGMVQKVEPTTGEVVWTLEDYIPPPPQF